MKVKPILIVGGEPNSIFLEIFFKSIKKLNIKHPLILIASVRLVKLQMKKFKINKKIKVLDLKNLLDKKLDNKSINILDVEYKTNHPFEKISSKSNIYIANCFDIAFKILRSGYTNKFINGPINKSTFLNKKFLGVTEYISQAFKTKKTAMLIYNKNLSVSPLTTHLPIKLVPRMINQKIIKEKVELINSFYLKNIGFKPTIAVTGLNPHCESILKFNEDNKIIKPAIESLRKKGYKINGPFPADTLFLKQNRNKFDVVLGMYHDQVLTPIKTIKEYDAINITLGLPFLRVSPDHGPNKKMVNKNISNPLSLINSLKFLDLK